MRASWFTRKGSVFGLLLCLLVGAARRVCPGRGRRRKRRNFQGEES